ncbi:hypothetical protein MRB53_040874 [Persea americana]|nr:hypothetical protein MRB53_040874 [Persea americana]
MDGSSDLKGYLLSWPSHGENEGRGGLRCQAFEIQAIPCGNGRSEDARIWTERRRRVVSYAEAITVVRPASVLKAIRQDTGPRPVISRIRSGASKQVTPRPNSPRSGTSLWPVGFEKYTYYSQIDHVYEQFGMTGFNAVVSSNLRISCECEDRLGKSSRQQSDVAVVVLLYSCAVVCDVICGLRGCAVFTR